MGEMMPIKEHNSRLEAQRHATATEIAELAASKHAALAERDEAMNRVSAVVQDCRREAYALRRVASNMAIHADVDLSKKELTRGPFQSSFTGKPVADIFTAAEESGTLASMSCFACDALGGYVTSRFTGRISML
jgi:hypothetical protein